MVSPHKESVILKMFLWHDIIMNNCCSFLMDDGCWLPKSGFPRKQIRTLNNPRVYDCGEWIAPVSCLLYFVVFIFLWPLYNDRADSSFVPNQWEMALLCNDICHWLGTNRISPVMMNLENCIIHIEMLPFIISVTYQSIFGVSNYSLTKTKRMWCWLLYNIITENS